jgi:hypothetical protein
MRVATLLIVSAGTGSTVSSSCLLMRQSCQAEDADPATTLLVELLILCDSVCYVGYRMLYSQHELAYLAPALW